MRDLAPGTYRVQLDSDRSSPFSTDVLSVTERGETDLGDIRLSAGATLRCTLLLAEGASPVGLSYIARSLSGFGEEITRADGRFELTGLAAGEHEIHIRSDGVRLLDDVVRRSEVAEGETRDVTIDLRGDLQSRVRVVVTSGGEPLEGVRVQLVELDDAGAKRRDARPRELGITNADGVARGNAPAGRRVSAVARSTEFFLGNSEPLELQPGEPPVVSLAVEVGTLALEFPADLEIPERGTLLLRLRPLAPDPLQDSRWMFWHGNTPLATRPTTNGVWDAPRVEVGRVGAGRYQLLLGAWSGGVGGEPLETLRPDLDLEVEVRAGEECTVPVPVD